MNDYSEVTCHLQRDVVNLINALNDKNWILANYLAHVLSVDAKKLSDFAYDREESHDRL